MKFLKVFFLCLLIVANSFAASFNAERSQWRTSIIGESVPTNIEISQNDDEKCESCSSRAILGPLSFLALVGGLIFVLIGGIQKGDEYYDQSKAKSSVAIGAVMSVVGVTGIVLLEW